MSGISVDIGQLDAFDSRLAAMGGAVRDALAQATTQLAGQLQSGIDSALAGGALDERSGALLASVTVEASSDASGAGATATASAPYAAFQEFGFAGPEAVREHLRRQSEAFGRPITPRDVLVRAYVRTLDYAGRFYMEGALDDMADDIVAAYTDAVTGALNG